MAKKTKRSVRSNVRGIGKVGAMTVFAAGAMSGCARDVFLSEGLHPGEIYHTKVEEKKDGSIGISSRFTVPKDNKMLMDATLQMYQALWRSHTKWAESKNADKVRAFTEARDLLQGHLDTAMHELRRRGLLEDFTSHAKKLGIGEAGWPAYKGEPDLLENAWNLVRGKKEFEHSAGPVKMKVAEVEKGGRRWKVEVHATIPAKDVEALRIRRGHIRQVAGAAIYQARRAFLKGEREKAEAFGEAAEKLLKKAIVSEDLLLHHNNRRNEETGGFSPGAESKKILDQISRRRTNRGKKGPALARRPMKQPGMKGRRHRA